MRAKKWMLSWALLMAALVGCDTTRQQIKPPVTADESKLPSGADARYSLPPKYPKGTLNQDRIARPNLIDPTMQPGGPGSFGQPGGFGSNQPASFRPQ